MWRKWWNRYPIRILPYVENLELKRSAKFFDRIVALNIDLYNIVTKGSSKDVQLHTKYLSIANILNKNDNLFGILCIIACLYAVKVNAWRTKSYGKNFNTLQTTGIYLGNGLFVKEIPKLQKRNILTKKFLEVDEKRIWQAYFLANITQENYQKMWQV